MTINLRDIERQANRLQRVRASCAVCLPRLGADPLLVVAVEPMPGDPLIGKQLVGPLNATLPTSHRVDGVSVIPHLERNAAGKIIVDRVRQALAREWT